MFVSIKVIVNQSPLLKEAMDPQNGSHITGKVASTSCHGEILTRIQTKAVHHKVTIGHVAGEIESGRGRGRREDIERESERHKESEESIFLQFVQEFYILLSCTAEERDLLCLTSHFW